MPLDRLCKYCEHTLVGNNWHFRNRTLNPGIFLDAVKARHLQVCMLMLAGVAVTFFRSQETLKREYGCFECRSRQGILS